MSGHDMTDEELLGYVQIHCETPRALFSRAHVERLHALAGVQIRWAGPPPAFYALHEEEAAPLLEAARMRASKKKADPLDHLLEIGEILGVRREPMETLGERTVDALRHLLAPKDMNGIPFFTTYRPSERGDLGGRWSKEEG